MRGSFTLALAACALPATLAATPRPGSPAGWPAVPGVQRASAAHRPGALVARPDSLTVAQAVARALATHPAILEARHGVAAARARVEERQTAFLPYVAAEGLYSRLGPVAQVELGNEAFKLFPANNYNANVALQQTLFDWGKREAAVDQARTLVAGAAEDVELVQSRLAYQTISAFYAIIFLRDAIAVQDEEIAALQRHLEITQEKVRSGTATDFEVLTTRVRIATARSQRVDLVDAQEEQTIALRQLLGATADEPLEPAGDFAADTTAVNADSLVTVALAQRPELKLARSAEVSAEAQTHVAALAKRPDLNLNVSVGGKNGYVPNLNRIKANFVAALAFELPLYDGNRMRARVGEAEAEVQATQAHTLSVARQVGAEVRRAAAAVGASIEKIRTAQVQVQEAEAALSLARTRYQAGVITNLDILDAETSLSGARLVELRARYGLIGSRYQLRQAVGEKVW